MDPEAAEVAHYDLSKFRSLFLAGERLDPETYRWAQAKLGVPVVDHWWQTETGWPIAASLRGLEPMPIRPVRRRCRCPGTTCGFWTRTAPRWGPVRKARSA
ncbi:possible acetate--CoA ligase, C-terminal (plasmid) [Rhodococcus jostii RHA1]|uniref:Possible acetate--CoA ligase, C-terminal n=1 Tax=Rhodococcus jostii (strain RHA1) TaxID=101510 RepID=Q0RZQ3_RHOJR|nr:possible acetate--CoA ligase, C-terminal [Rhodococcus jostii RHA1]